METNSRFTEGAQRVLQISQKIAQQLGNNYVGTEHLLIGLCMDEGGMAGKVLHNAGVDESMVVSALTRGGVMQAGGPVFDYTPRVKRIINASMQEAKNMGNSYVGTEHLLLALLRENEGVADQLLRQFGVDPEALIGELEHTAESGRGGGTGAATPTLDKFGKDFTQAARDGELDPVVGRNTEIERIVQILSRRTKNNPVLVGDPGVGKSAVVEGLASRIVSGNIPETLKDKRLVSLDLAGMLAGAKYRGEFEERIKNVLDEVKKASNVILFIDELHTIVGAGASEGAIDAANILKPMLARGEMQVIGATTLNEYRKYIEKDAALERRFQPVTIGEPTPEEAEQILLGLRDRYEAHHKVRITNEAIKAAVALSDRYISDRFLPDKAIDLMDEAASRVRIRSFIAPPDVKKLEDKLASIAKEKEEAVKNQQFERAAALRDEEPKLRAEIDKLRTEWESSKQASAESVVTADDIAHVVASWTNIPVEKMTEDESERLLHLEEILHRRVIGQDAAVNAVAAAIRRARAGLKDPRRPVGSYLFLGPTGVGKTELSKALAEAMFGDEDAIIRLDMSEYMEPHSVSKLIGSPPGYVGYDEGGQLTEKVRRKPYSVVLFDEIEKAHPDVFNALLQVLDDGRLTDSQGRTVDFRNTIIIMTSNVGARTAQSARVGFANDADKSEGFAKAKENMLSALKKTFRPEFLNRIDEIIVFEPLNEEDTKKIVSLMMGSVEKRLEERGIHLTMTDEALSLLAKEGFDPEYGARPLRRAIQQKVEDSLSEEILKKAISLGDDVVGDVVNGELHFAKKGAEEPAAAEEAPAAEMPEEEGEKKD